MLPFLLYIVPLAIVDATFLLYIVPLAISDATLSVVFFTFIFCRCFLFMLFIVPLAIVAATSFYCILYL
jgi:hypothetical protein